MELTIKHFELMAHSLGINLFHAMLSDKKADRTFPESHYRNHFNTAPNGVEYERIIDLVNQGLMFQIKPDYYGVTEEGKAGLGIWFVENFEYKPKSKQDLNYLLKKINPYTMYYRYKFGEDNAAEILKYYKNYTSKGFKTSHTVTDTINRFKTQLKKHYRISPELF